MLRLDLFLNQFNYVFQLSRFLVSEVKCELWATHDSADGGRGQLILAAIIKEQIQRSQHNLSSRLHLRGLLMRVIFGIGNIKGFISLLHLASAQHWREGYLYKNNKYLEQCVRKRRSNKLNSAIVCVLVRSSASSCVISRWRTRIRVECTSI
jgi:hypothetical protein